MISEYLTLFVSRLVNRIDVIDLLSQSELPEHRIIKTSLTEPKVSELDKSKYEPGDVIKLVDGQNHQFAYIKSINPIDVGFLNKPNSRIPADFIDTFKLESGMIENFKGSPIETTVGKFIFNYIGLVIPFGDKISYINSQAKMGKVESLVVDLGLKKEITAQQIWTFGDCVFYLGDFAELCVPTFTKKAFMTDPKIKIRKQELLKQYSDDLTNPETIIKIENELLKLDKEYLGDDSVCRFYDGIGSKTYNIHRKKMFLTVGGIEEFSKGTGGFSFVPNSLSEGWDINSFPAICDEIRKGSYDRGKETAKGGMMSNFVMRVFQDFRITEDDCHTKRGLSIDMDDKNIKNFINQYTTSGELITNENRNKFINKTVVVRSPAYCKTKTGICKKCCGEEFKVLDVEGLTAIVVAISAKMMNLAMKSMHGTKLELSEINPLDYLVIH
jgi:hypothetical protein